MTSITDMKETVGNLNGTLTAMQGQLVRMETTLGEVKKEVEGHGRWFFALKVFGYLAGATLTWALVNVVWPLLKRTLSLGH